MKRKLFTLFLVSYLAAFAAPFMAAADDEEESGTDDGAWDTAGLCSQSHKVASSTTSLATDADYQAFASNLEKTIKYGSENGGGECGETNPTTSLLEKGDCSAEGKIVSEITEPIAPNVTLDDNTFVMGVFQGTCCFVYYQSDPTDLSKISCRETRTVYTDDYKTCTEAGVGCQERQWLIAESGTGLLKLFVKQIYTWGAFAVGSMAVGTIIFQGIKISLSGVSGDISEAKTKILQAIGGIVLLFVSSLILYTINPDFFS